MHYLTALITALLVVPSTAIESKLERLRGTGRGADHVDDNDASPLNIDEYFEEDEKFWERHLQGFLSTVQPTLSPTFPSPISPPPIGQPISTPPPIGQPISTPPPVFIATPAPSPVVISTPIPTTIPSPAVPSLPTRSPSQVLCQGITQLERAQQLTDLAIGASGRIIPGSPQDLALEWLIQTDPYEVCPDDPKALQRYILAVFYFSTDGDNWDECSAPSDPNDVNTLIAANNNCGVTTTPIPGGQLNPSFLPTTEGRFAWLTPIYECEWAGITCRVETSCVDRIEFGE